MFQCRQIFTISAISLACVSSIFAAVPVSLDHQSAAFLKSFANVKAQASEGMQTSLKQISRSEDFNQTTHLRFQQTVNGYPVWGSDSVVHIAAGKPAVLNHVDADSTMNGTLYQNILADLHTSPAYFSTAAQKEKALQQAIKIYQGKTGIKQVETTQAKNELMVYVDQKNNAHWAYYIAFLSHSENGELAVPTYILDASTLDAYEEWNDAQTLDDITASGYGGNPKMGKITYDGRGRYPKLNMKRDPAKKVCLLQNSDVVVFDDNHSHLLADADVAKFKCKTSDPQHGDVFWDGEIDAVNDGYSPANDALYIGQIIKEMYKSYGQDILGTTASGTPLKMNVHARDFSNKAIDNAMFLSVNKEMYFGDGVSLFYPLTSLGVGAHEISHGFTSEHSNLVYTKQSGGLNESFSDMAAQAAEYYASIPHTNSWQIGPEIVKADKALRYMDDPTKDGKSIANVNDYTDSLNVHYSSGVFNKFFYVLSTAPGWDTKKAFDVMLHANMNYWTSTSTFQQAACGVIQATRDYSRKGYDMSGVAKAINAVGLTSSC